ncbi:MAG TPA: HD domain-containing protein [Patescibacteria group bacterium]|nr:HD domain-containing protein [Patescibacteria group bacterium]
MDSELRAKLEAVRGCLSHLAAKDADARRRQQEEDEDAWMAPFGSPYAADVNKLLCSKAIRRLGRKTQVVAEPVNGHVRDRLSHTFEVASVATTVARILGLNADLCQATALGHDIGHTPYGHFGEKFMTELIGKEFRHEVFSVVVAQKIERKGKGLNLCHRTLRGMLEHSRGEGDLRLGDGAEEGNVTMYADKIAYVMADFNDLFSRRSIAEGAPKLDDHPKLAAEMAWFGPNQRSRVATCVAGLCLESAAKGRVSFADCEAAQRFAAAKKLMYDVYHGIHWEGADEELRLVYEWLEFSQRCRAPAPVADPRILLALLNDRDVRLIADAWGNCDHPDIDALSIADVIPHLAGVTIDLADPDLDW